VQNRHVVMVLVSAVVLFQSPSVGTAETHQEIQAVDANGIPTHPKVGADASDPANKVILAGVVLNNPEDMLDPTYDAAASMGAQWQIVVAGEGADHAGTALWMGQKYSLRGGVDYEQWEWADEMLRVNYDDGHHLRRGDRVRVTGYVLEYGGKANMNERHSSSPYMDFSVEYLGRAGLADPEVITLADVKHPDDADIFDPTGATGGERWQNRLVRIMGVHFVDPGAVAPGATAVIADATGRTLPVRCGIGTGMGGPLNLDATFDLVGIFDQDAGFGQHTTGYRVWALDYSGGASVFGTPWGDLTCNTDVDAADVDALAAALRAGSGGDDCDLDGDDAIGQSDMDCLVRTVLATEYGDADLDGAVSLSDLSVLAFHWDQAVAAGWADGDFNADEGVTLADLSILAFYWGAGTADPAPEPGALALLAVGALALRRRREGTAC